MRDSQGQKAGIASSLWLGKEVRFEKPPHLKILPPGHAPSLLKNMKLWIPGTQPVPRYAGMATPVHTGNGITCNC